MALRSKFLDLGLSLPHSTLVSSHVNWSKLASLSALGSSSVKWEESYYLHRLIFLFQLDQIKRLLQSS